MEDKSSLRERINSNPSRMEMTLFALVLGVMSAVSFYLFDSLVYPLIGDPAPEEWRRPITTSIFFGVLAFVGVLFWAGVGRFVEENCPGFRGDSE